jgi:cytidylate kinase
MIGANLDRCLSFINSHSTPTAPRPEAVGIRRAITISRQAGCGGVIVAEKLANYLEQHSTDGHKPWTMFDRNLMQQVLADHKLPAHLEKFLPEDRVSAIEDTLADIFGVRPTAETLVQQTAETILKFVELGNVIIVGRGANFITAKQEHVLHVRLVAPLEDRIERIVRDDGKTPAEARKFCLEEDQQRARYIKKYFHADINDSVNYHLVINTTRLGYDNVAKLIGECALRV